MVDVLGTQENIVVMDSKTIQSGNVAESDGQYSNLPLYNDSAAGFDEGFLNGLSGSEVYLTNINEGVLFGWSD
ncbi:unnamed protein product [Ilex paraguariensis]|uniref:Uncharacterized protein n=1 Tax=Ilex paraguariensis TaxID=185542 RepID=A0ABC8RFJ1_9AQUA